MKFVNPVALVLFVFGFVVTEAHDVRVKTVGELKTERSYHHVESRCTDAAGWVDEWDDGCDAYAANTTWCETWGDAMGTTSNGDQIVVTEACCACGGGTSGPTTPTAPSPTPPTPTPPTPTPPTPTPPAPTPPSGGGGGSVAQAWVTAHNTRRAQYGKPAASWDAALAEQAKAWTDYLVKKSCTLQHISEQCSFGTGENLATNWGSPVTIPETPEEVLKGWTEDEMDKVPTHGHEQAGHATQVLWKHSTKIGCATSTGSCGAVSACRYHNGGNCNCSNCVTAILQGVEEACADPLPSTSQVDKCNRDTLSDFP